MRYYQVNILNKLKILPCFVCFHHSYWADSANERVLWKGSFIIIFWVKLWVLEDKLGTTTTPPHPYSYPHVTPGDVGKRIYY